MHGGGEGCVHLCVLFLNCNKVASSYCYSTYTFCFKCTVEWRNNAVGYANKSIIIKYNSIITKYTRSKKNKREIIN